MKPIRKTLPALALASAIYAAVGAAPAWAAAEPTDYKQLEKFMSVYERVKSIYVDKVDDKVLVKGAIDGMLAALDPHSSYAEESDFEALKTTTDGNYGGLGVTVAIEDGAVKVIAPTEDTPADRAGIKAGDYFTHINNELVYGLTLDDAVAKMRGAPGTSIQLTVVRPGRPKPMEMSITREIIELKPVKWEVKDGVGILNINAFTGNVADETRAAMSAIDKSTGGKPLGYVVDLRSNPGGLVDQAVQIADVFLDGGEVVSQRGREKEDIERMYASPGQLAHDLPVVVLIDAGSASASEILAGALQDHRRALVLGEQSFGKGSVQSVMQTGPDAALKLTTARYFTPSGKSVQAGGISPDIAVPQLSDPDYKDRPRVREADLRRHLLAQATVDDKLLQKDSKADPRFAMTAEELKKKGVKDFQLDYAVNTLKRLSTTAATPAQVAVPKKGQ